MPVGKLTKRQWEESLHGDVNKQIKDIQRQYKAGKITGSQAQYFIEELTNSAGQTMDAVKEKGAIAGMTTAADSMGVASSGREAIAELKDMAASRKEGDRISLAFRQDGKTVVYDANVNAYGNLGLISQREATSKEEAALKEKYDIRSAVGNETGIWLSGDAPGKANNELQLPLTSRGMDGTLKLPGNVDFYGEPTGIKQETGIGKTLSVEGAGSKSGKFIDNTTDAMTKGERQVVDDLVGKGKTVERIPKSDVKTPDFKVNGVKTELKTLENANTNTGMKRIQEGFKQGAETVIIDARGSGLTNSQASEILSRVSGKYSNRQLPGNVEIWIDGKVITYP